MLTIIELAVAGLVSYWFQALVRSSGGSMPWQYLLSIPPTAMVLEIFEEVRRAVEVRKITKVISKMKEEYFIFRELGKIAKNHYIWCRNERVTKIPTLCVYMDCPHKKYSTDIPSGCSKCRMFQMTDQNRDWKKAKRTHDFATVNTKVEQGE